MENRVFAKTLLSVYNLIDNFCDCLDKTVYSKSIASSGLSNINFDNTYTIADSILQLMDRKINLINLKVKIEKAIVSLDEIDAKILVLKYVDELNAEQCAGILLMSERNLFRRLSSCLLDFSVNMQKQGVSISTFKQKFQHESWIFNRFDRFCEEEIIKCKPKTKVLRHHMSQQVG